MNFQKRYLFMETQRDQGLLANACQNREWSKAKARARNTIQSRMWLVGTPLLEPLPCVQAGVRAWSRKRHAALTCRWQASSRGASPAASWMPQQAAVSLAEEPTPKPGVLRCNVSFRGGSLSHCHSAIRKSSELCLFCF